MRLPVFAWIVCVIGLLALMALWLVRPITISPPTVAGSAAIGGAFTLTDHHGKIVTDKSWPESYLLLYFGFTHCPDICPMGLTTITEALNVLPADKLKKLQPLFITVDPQRDTVSMLASYMNAFHPKIIALTGSTEQIETVKKAWRVYAEKDGNDRDYMVNHSAFTYLVAPDGQLAHVFAHGTKSDEMANKLANIIK